MFSALLTFLVTLVPVPPVSGAVVSHFSPPACRFCAGHRGIVVATAEGIGVVAAVSGRLTFVGQVAGRIYVVEAVGADPAVTLTYGWMTSAAPGLAAGTIVAQGSTLGVAGPRTYLGAKRDGQPIDPMAWLGVRRTRLTDRVSEVFGAPRGI